MPGEADLLISKHRNGALGTVTLTFLPEYPRFMNQLERGAIRVSEPYAVCELGLCDGSGFIEDNETRTASNT